MDLTQGNWEKQLNSELNDGAVIIDVRTPEEFEVSRIPNSINIDFYNPQKFITKIDKLDRKLDKHIQDIWTVYEPIKKILEKLERFKLW